jgi:hypothetical protein
MNTNQKLVWVSLTGFALLVPVVLAFSTGSPWYLLLIIVLLVAVGALWFFLPDQQEGLSASAPKPATREPEQASEPLLEEVLTEIELPTTRPDYPLIFSARVVWQPIPQPPGEPPHADLAAVARHSVIERASSFVREREPSDLDVARSALAAQLGGMQPDPTGRVRAQAANVALVLRDDDLERLRAEADRRKNGLAWQQEQDCKRNVMDYLQGDVLTSPARALVWWMAEHPGDIQGAVDRVGQLTRLSAVSQGRGDPSVAGPHLVPAPGMRPAERRDLTATRDLLSGLFPESQDKREFFAREPARLADESGHEDYGRRVRQDFGLTPRVTTAEPYLDYQESPDPEDEPPYLDDDEPTTA